MNSKAQTLVLKEVILFAVGLGLVIGIATLFADYINPYFLEATLSKQQEQLISHVDFILVELYALLPDSASAKLTRDLELPLKISNSEYNVFIENREICMQSSSINKQTCIETALPSTVTLSGEYVSGHDMTITLERTGSQVNASFSI